MTLLEKAKGFEEKRTRRANADYNDEHLELVKAYFNGEISLKQFGFASESKNPVAVYLLIYKTILYGFTHGKVKILD